MRPLTRWPRIAAISTAALAACRSTANEPTSVMNGRSQAVRAGQEVQPAGSTAFGVTLLSVEQDSRCPRSVMCVSAGTAEAEQEGISINQLIATSLAGDERSSAIVVHRRPAVPSVRETLRSDHARDRTLNRSMWRLDQMAAASPNTSPTRR
jgi:hypothetical protein